MPFTVLMPTYGGDDYKKLRAAAESALANSLQPDEFILVVDGPIPEDNNDVVSDLQANYGIQVLRISENAGIVNALNTGLSKIKTELVARADADDINLPDRFQKQIEEMTSRNLDLLGGQIEEIDENGRMAGSRKVPLEYYDIIKYAKKRNPFNHMTTIFSREIALTAGGYPNIKGREDYGLWARFLHRTRRVANLSDTLVVAAKGNNFVERRGGIKYAVAELNLQHELVSCGIKSKKQAIISGSARAIAFSMPSFARQEIYKHFLRKA